VERSGTPRLIGIILAAGESRRMGRPKALLPCPPSGDTFLTQAVRTLHTGGVEEVGVVGRRDDSALRLEVGRQKRPVAYLENLNPALGQLSSLLVGVAYAEACGADGVMVLPVDIPSVKAATVQALREAFGRGTAPIVRAVHQGRHGHPVIFGRMVFAELRAADLSRGAREVLRRDPARVCEVALDDPGVLRDVDVPDDYRRLVDGD
jgi:molybdenum cofactor cytidylyltransferase